MDAQTALALVLDPFVFNDNTGIPSLTFLLISRTNTQLFIYQI
jgi:hypothetical protein